MIALQYARFGDPATVLEPVETAVPLPEEGQVRLRMLRSPVHNHDLATIRGVYGVKPALPATGGSEMLGIVEAAGHGSDIAEGTRVVCATRGAWAEYALASAAALVPVPDAIPDDLACQLIAMPVSALVLLDELRVHAGDWIAMNAANGAVGRILLREAQRRGIHVIALVRSEETAAELRAFGAANVVVTQGEWVKAARALANGAPIVRAVDSVAGPESLQMQRLLAEGGELVVFGGLAGEPMRLDPSLMISRELIVRGFWMNAWGNRPENRPHFAKAMQRVFELALAHELPLETAGVYALRDVHAALAATTAPGRVGKILFRP